MIEPIALENMLGTVVSAASLIICGAGYAFSYAHYRQQGAAWSGWMATICYLLLLASLALLSQWARFDRHWLWLSGSLALGYGLAPVAIWHLCVKTHTDYHEDKS